MEVFDGVDLDDLPSNAFDSSLSDDEFSSWPSEGSPDPLDRDDESMDLSDEGAEDEYGDYEDYDEHGGHDWEENEDHHSDEYHEHSGSEYGGGEIEFMFDGENEVLQEDEDREGEGFRDLEGGFDDNDDQPSPRPHLPDRRSVAELFTGFQPRHQPTRSAFPPGSRPDSPPANILPPIDTILSSLGLGAMPEMESRRRQSLRSPGQERYAERSVGRIRENQQQNFRQPFFNSPQNTGRARGRVTGNTGRRNSNAMLDELVEVEVESAPRAPMRRHRPPQPAQLEVIDLTGEPDSPEEPRAAALHRPRPSNASNAPQNPGRHARRQLSLNPRTPSLSRSDGSLLGNNSLNNPNFIDLTGDDSPASPPPLPQPLPQPLPHRIFPPRNHQNNNHHRHHHHHHHHHPRRPPQPAMSRDQPIDLDEHEELRASFAGFAGLVRRAIPGLGFIHRFARLPNPHAEFEVQIIGGRGLNMDNPLAGNAPNLNYGGNGHNAGGGGSPKPDHVPPPPAREGFTRNTGGDGDVVVCPGCEQELKYDPDAGAEDGAAPPAKKPRTRKDQEEHHFWALKECGHVYCKDCFENRKSRSKSATTPFRRDDRRVLCAVDGCSAEANNKLNWVGLFV